MSLLVNPRVDHFEVLRCQRFGFFLGKVTKLFVISMLAHASCSSMPLAPLTPLPISYGHGGILLLEHGFLARLTYYSTLSARVCSFPYRKRFHLLPRTKALQVKRVGVKKATPNHCFVTLKRPKAPCFAGTITNDWNEQSVTYLAFAGFSRISLYIWSKMLLMCWKSGTVNFWIGPKSKVSLNYQVLSQLVFAIRSRNSQSV